jgi:hypothetical protein
MPSADLRLVIALLLLAPGSASLSAQKDPGPPRRIPGYVMPPDGDSLIKDGSRQGRILSLACEPYLGHLEAGDDARCVLRSGVVDGNVTTFTVLDSFPEINVANPNVATAPRKGALHALTPGYSPVWATFHGAIARDFVTIGPRQGDVTLTPAVTDTTIQVGQSYRFRLAYHDSAGREQLDARQATMALGWWGQPGRFDTVGLNVFEITPREPGKVEVMMSRGRRNVTVTVHVDPAPTPVPAAPIPKPNVVPILARTGGAAIQIQVIDTASPPRVIPISIDGKIYRTDKDGWFRGRADPGVSTVAVYCPATTLPAGPMILRTTLRFASGQNPRTRIRVSSAPCPPPGERRERGTFVGHYRNGTVETFTSCRALSPSVDAQRQALVAIEAPGFVPKQLDDTTSYFARFEGTLIGPGSRGTADYYLRVTRVLELRPTTANDCD